MELSNNTILVVDDDAHIRRLVSAALRDSYHIIEAASAPDAIKLVEKHQPMIALLDILLEDDTNGKEICKAIKENEDPSKPCGVIFISGVASEEGILECYELGADDFVQKPFNIQNLRKKIDTQINHQRLIQSLKHHEQELENLVGTTMGQASSYGSALNSVKAMNYVSNERDLAKLLFEYFRSNGLYMAVHFRHPTNPCYYDALHDECSAIQKEVFSLTKDKGRLFSFGNRLIINDQHVSILVKNAPAQEEMSYGIFIDVVAVLIEALEARYVAMINERRILEAQHSISDLVSDVKVTIAGIQQSKQDLIDKLVTELGLSFHTLDLTMEQEEFFTKLIEKAVLAHDAGNEEFYELSSKLEQAVKLLTVEEHTKIETDPDDVVVDDGELTMFQ